MDVSAEAKRIMVQALGKLYTSRSQRGGLRLHRSLLLSLVMRTARDIYHTARIACETEEQPATALSVPQQPTTKEVMDTGAAAFENSASPQTKQPSDGEISLQRNSCARTREDKENCNPTVNDRHSRKRRCKAATEPDFLPSKRARMDTDEERPVVRNGVLRNSTVNCCRIGDSLTSLSISRPIAAF